MKVHKLEQYELKSKGVTCNMWQLQVSMISWMIHLARTQPEGRYNAKQGRALTYFIKSYCENNYNQESVEVTDDAN